MIVSLVTSETIVIVISMVVTIPPVISIWTRPSTLTSASCLIILLPIKRKNAQEFLLSSLVAQTTNCLRNRFYESTTLSVEILIE